MEFTAFEVTEDGETILDVQLGENYANVTIPLYFVEDEAEVDCAYWNG